MSMDFKALQALLPDAVSQIYFEARQNYLEDPRLSSFYRIIRKAGEHYQFRDVNDFLTHCSPAGWILWGTDDVAQYHFQLLKDNGWEVVYCSGNTDSDRLTQMISLEEASELVSHHHYAVLSAEPWGQSEASAVPFPENQILRVKGHLVGRNGWQYFDEFQPGGSEVFLDGGCLDGATTREFIKWCHGDYQAVYAAEANPLQLPELRTILPTIPRAQLTEAALWDCDCTLPFRAMPFSKWDACVSDSGNYQVPATTIDRILDGQKLTFLKLDIEGAELQALSGARKSILHWKPRLAVSVYHHPMDLFQILDWLHRLVPEYRFSLRHYHSDCIETILYACI